MPATFIRLAGNNVAAVPVVLLRECVKVHQHMTGDSYAQQHTKNQHLVHRS